MKTDSNQEKRMNNRIITQEEISDLFIEEIDPSIDQKHNPYRSTYEWEPLCTISPSKVFQHDYYNPTYFIESQSNYPSNSLFLKLSNYFDEELVLSTLLNYKVGTSHYWNDSPIYWYLDMNQNICAGEIIIENEEKTQAISIQTEFNKLGFIKKDFFQKETLYGEHLLKNNKKPIAIVELEEAAIIASMQFPEYLWLATGKNVDLNYKRIKKLMGLDVTLCPSNDNFESWYKYADEYGFKISLKVIQGMFFLGNYVSCSAGEELSECILYLLNFKKELPF